MIVLDQLWEALASVQSQVGLWLVVWVVALSGFSCWIFFLARTLQTPRRWVVRRGECPFCGHVLFGTTEDYQRLCLLDVGASENQYLCTGCDARKIAGLVSLLQDG